MEEKYSRASLLSMVIMRNKYIAINATNASRVKKINGKDALHPDITSAKSAWILYHRSDWFKFIDYSINPMLYLHYFIQKNFLL